MKKKQQERRIKSLSSSDYVSLFLPHFGVDFRYSSSDVHIYDYKKVANKMKVPTTVFRPAYNYVLLLQDGKISMQFDSEMKQIYAPAALYVSAGQVISVRAVSKDISGTLVILENECLIRLFSEQELLKLLQVPHVISLSEENHELVNAIGRLLLKEYKSEKSELKVLIALSQALLYKLIKYSGISDILSRKQTTALKFKELVYTNFVSQKKISFYTHQLGVSENYLNRCTRLIFSESAKRFILEVAIMQSQLLLQDMQKTIGEVAYELNFEDTSYFSRIFRKITGQTPSHYKQQISSDN